MAERTPTDGRPFYCKTCGAGYAEYVACEAPDCELEDPATALQRRGLPSIAERQQIAIDAIRRVIFHEPALQAAIKAYIENPTVPGFHTGGVIKGSGLRADEVPAILRPTCCHPAIGMPYSRHTLGLPEPEGPPLVVTVTAGEMEDPYTALAGQLLSDAAKRLRIASRTAILGRPLFGEELDD